MVDQKSPIDESKKENKFDEQQPLRHPLAAVKIVGKQIKINKQLYQVLVDKQEALDTELLSKKYDPYLDQYDYIVGDVSSEHLRLKGFFKDKVQTAIDRKEQTIADYLMEYCNPGGGYFILQLVSPVHHYRNTKFKRRTSVTRYKKQTAPNNKTATFKKYKKSASRIKKPKTVTVKKAQANNHTFVIKKRKGSN
ncbi:YutD family protein [Lactobacillus apis]|uniref:YutD family protein n=1 Tax=Lactobacillus apis TaxID=303541 RepID=UPI00242B15B1|nr:YutD family protein [Lactobacillus apis]